MSLDNAAANCDLLRWNGPSHYPAVVNYMDSLGAVVACGGRHPSDADYCSAYDGSEWIRLSKSLQQHCNSGSNSLITDKGLWITGSLQDWNGCLPLQWTSTIFSGLKWMEGPLPPKSAGGSCPAMVNSTHSVLTGGDPSMTKTWLYDWTADTWTESGELNEGRYGHSCAELEGQGVLVVGGTNGDNVFSVELYDPETGVWTPQPSLPQDIDPVGITLLPFAGSVIALFNGDDHVYQRAEDGTWSALEGVLLPDPFAVIDKITLAPDDFANGCM